MTVTIAIIGRQYCPQCRIVRAFVAVDGVEELRCPVCETVTVPASGPDVIERRP